MIDAARARAAPETDRPPGYTVWLMTAVSALAVLVTALALYVTRGVLDVIATPEGMVRVALLPPWPSLGGFVVVGALALVCLDRRPQLRQACTAIGAPLAAVALPLFGLAVLVLPYLPVLADLVPGLQMLAGPARWIVWAAIAIQIAWVLHNTGLVRADWMARVRPSRLAVAVGLASAVLCGLIAARFTGTVLYPAGDEPHYLVIAQSLWRDGDLRIENNHARGDYREYLPMPLDPHYLTRGVDGEIYSIHPVGMPVLMAPVYAFGGYRLVVAAFVAMAAIASALAWRRAFETSGAGPATFAVAAVVATAPFLFNAFAIYPEIPAALVVMLLLDLLWRAHPPRAAEDTPLPWARRGRWLAAGALAGTLPWLSTKYAPMSAALVMLAIGRILWPRSGSPARAYVPGDAPAQVGDHAPAGAGAITPVNRQDDTIRGDASGGGGEPLLARVREQDTRTAVAALLVPYVVAIAGWLAFFGVIWGVPLPQSPYGGLVQTDVANLLFGAPGLLFDQEYGLLAYAPVYILAATGAGILWREGGERRRRALELSLVFATLLGTVGAFRIWWGGSAPAGRPLVSGLLPLAIPIAAAVAAAPAGSARRAAQHLLLWISLGVTGVLVFAQQGLLIFNDRDGTSRLLEYLSPAWPAWTLAPSFIHHEAPTAMFHTSLWLALAAVVAWVLRSARAAHAGSASLCAIATTAAALALATITMPLLPLAPPWPELDPRARARLPVLDEFDTRSLPIALRYTPFSLAAPADLVSLASVEVTPGARRDRQPVRVLHNGRFSLPAGTYRVQVEWGAAHGSEPIGLQVGRTGKAWRQWTVAPRPGEQWSAEFTIPVDASFVGLRGSPELERAVSRIRITPIQVTDRSRRPRTPPILAALDSGPASIFFYDTNAFPEENGFWIAGAQRTVVSIHVTENPLRLLVHSGPVANRLELSMFGLHRAIDLSPDSPQLIEVPHDDALVTLELSAEQAFVPSERDPSSRDGRALGVWVEVQP